MKSGVVNMPNDHAKIQPLAGFTKCKSKLLKKTRNAVRVY